MNKKDKLSVEPYKGVRDFYPEDQAFLNYIFATCRRTVQQFGYVEYHASILEPSELYKSKGAENEEIINEQTYSFIDRGGREVTLRPEMTPSVARMVAGRRRDLGFPLRLFSIPNLFRYERPQRGRLREHWQLNVDLFGSKSLAVDAEVITVAHSLMLAFGAAQEDFVIKLGSRTFLDKLSSEHNLSPENSRAFMALLDRRNKMSKEEFDAKLSALGVPEESLSNENIPDDVALVLANLLELGVSNAIFDASIVRGFNYYTGVVFELYDTHPENNRALFGGGRYDNLTAMFDEEPITGVGFGMGDATIENFLAVRNLLPPYIPPTKVYIAITNSEHTPLAQRVAHDLREGLVATAIDFGDKKLADQIKTATKHNIPFLIVIGDNEKTSNEFTVRTLGSGEEATLSRDKLVEYITSL